MITGDLSESLDWFWFLDAFWELLLANCRTFPESAVCRRFTLATGTFRAIARMKLH